METKTEYAQVQATRAFFAASGIDINTVSAKSIDASLKNLVDLEKLLLSPITILTGHIYFGCKESGINISFITGFTSTVSSPKFTGANFSFQSANKKFTPMVDLTNKLNALTSVQFGAKAGENPDRLRKFVKIANLLVASADPKSFVQALLSSGLFSLTVTGDQEIIMLMMTTAAELGNWENVRGKYCGKPHHSGEKPGKPENGKPHGKPHYPKSGKRPDGKQESNS